MFWGCLNRESNPFRMEREWKLWSPKLWELVLSLLKSPRVLTRPQRYDCMVFLEMLGSRTNVPSLGSLSLQQNGRIARPIGPPGWYSGSQWKSVWTENLRGFPDTSQLYRLNPHPWCHQRPSFTTVGRGGSKVASDWIPCQLSEMWNEQRYIIFLAHPSIEQD